MKVLGWIALTFLALSLLFSLYVRLAPVDRQNYAQPPDLAPNDGKPHEYRKIGEDAPLFNIGAKRLAEVVDQTVMAQPRIKRFAGDPKSGEMVYEQRSFLMGYPDYIAFKITPIDQARSRLEFLSRSRYGYRDMGVNQSRMVDWLSKIEQASSE